MINSYFGGSSGELKSAAVLAMGKSLSLLSSATLCKNLCNIIYIGVHRPDLTDRRGTNRTLTKTVTHVINWIFTNRFLSYLVVPNSENDGARNIYKTETINYYGLHYR